MLRPHGKYGGGGSFEGGDQSVLMWGKVGLNGEEDVGGEALWGCICYRELSVYVAY